jgi:membrane fusion protein, copper/silver efflux system
MITILFLGIGLFTACEKRAAKEEGVYYTCPMHPQVKKDEPGKCPICGMDLVKRENSL